MKGVFILPYIKQDAIGELKIKYKQRYDELSDIEKKVRTLELELEVLMNVSDDEASNNNFLQETIKEVQSELKSLRDYMGNGKIHLELETLSKIMEAIRATQ